MENNGQPRYYQTSSRSSFFSESLSSQVFLNEVSVEYSVFQKYLGLQLDQ